MRPILKINSIRNILFIGTFIGLIALTQSCGDVEQNDASIEKLAEQMESIQSKYVPDRREQIFDFEISSSGSKITGRSSNRDAYERVLELTSNYPELNLDSFYFVTPVGAGLINVSVGNIRSKPGHSAELSTQVLMGQQVTIWDREGYWSYIQTPDGYLGWIDGGALVETDEAELNDYHSADKVMYTGDFGFSYETPDEDGPVVTDLVAGDILRVTGANFKYLAISLPDGRKGYVAKKDTRPLKEIEEAGIPTWNDIESTAFQFMGRPYLWGGTSGKGVDCSGFTKMVYYLNGLELPRDASQQVRSGIDVPLDENLSQLQPGDLLFFGYKRDHGPDRITHVAIYIGDGRIIHSSQRVQVESLIPGDPDFAPNRRKTLLTAKRMILDDSLAQGVIPIKNKKEYGF